MLEYPITLKEYVDIFRDGKAAMTHVEASRFKIDINRKGWLKRNKDVPIYREDVLGYI